MTSTKYQINYNFPIPKAFGDNVQNGFDHLPVREAGLEIVIWNLFVICLLLFAASFVK